MRTAALVGALLLILVAWIQGMLESSNHLDIRKVSVRGELKMASQQELQGYYSALMGKNLLLTPLAEMLAIAKSPPWVDSATVRKIWPDALEITVKEYTPVASWQVGQFISASGKVIVPDRGIVLPLPQLSGPDGTHETVLEQFGLISQVLSITGLKVQALTLESRGAWKVRFDNQLEVLLGRDEILERLQRFIAVYKSDLSGKIDKITLVDARYPHGVAVSWKEN